MQEKLSIVPVAIVSTTLLAATIAISLTLQPGFAVCSSKSDACASSTNEFGSQAFHTPGTASDSFFGSTASNSRHGSTSVVPDFPGVGPLLEASTTHKSAFNTDSGCGPHPGIVDHQHGDKILCAG